MSPELASPLFPLPISFERQAARLIKHDTSTRYKSACCINQFFSFFFNLQSLVQDLSFLLPEIDRRNLANKKRSEGNG